MTLDLLNITGTLFYKPQQVRMLANFKLLCVCQLCRGSLVASQPTNGPDEIVASRRAKINSLAIFVDKRWHVIPFINISPMAHNLPPFFRSHLLYSDTSLAKLNDNIHKRKNRGNSEENLRGVKNLPFNLFPEARRKS
jgi:hypothetical protein